MNCSFPFYDLNNYKPLSKIVVAFFGRFGCDSFYNLYNVQNNLYKLSQYYSI